MSLPLARSYVQSLDLTFRWGRGDGYLDVLRGHRQGYDDTGLIERVPVDRCGWVDTADVYRVANAWLARNRPDWHRTYGHIPLKNNRPVSRDDVRK